MVYDIAIPTLFLQSHFTILYPPLKLPVIFTEPGLEPHHSLGHRGGWCVQLLPAAVGQVLGQVEGARGQVGGDCGTAHVQMGGTHLGEIHVHQKQ